MKLNFKRRQHRMTANQKLILGGVLSILFITIGYSVMQNIMRIRGYATIDVGDGMMFTRVDIKENSGATIDSVPGVKAKTMVTASVTFEGAGSVTFTVAAQNQGSFDAKLIEIQKLNNLNGQAPQCIQTKVTNHNVGETVYPGVIKTFDVTVTSTCTERSSKEIEIYFKYKKQETQAGETTPPSLGNLVEYLTNNKVLNHVDDGKSGLVAIGNDGEITTSTTPREYRYIGPSPDNYVYFNDELWRIIGIFNGELKIMRAKAFPDEMAWDKGSASGGTHGKDGRNDWSKATLQEYLNGEYLNSINSASQRYILNYTWNLGGAELGSTSDDLVDTVGTAHTLYKRERGLEVYIGSPTHWTGKIALMYPSDYGYATSGGSTSTRSSCLTMDLGTWYVDSPNTSDCYNNNWIYHFPNPQWTLTPVANYEWSALVVGGGGPVGGRMAVSGGSEIYPTLFLNSKVEFFSGSGQKNDPYTLYPTKVVIEPDPEPKPNVLIRVVDTDGNQLSGNKFRILDMDGKYVDSNTYVSESTPLSLNLPAGDYIVQPWEALDGYRSWGRAILTIQAFDDSVNEAVLVFEKVTGIDYSATITAQVTNIDGETDTLDGETLEIGLFEDAEKTILLRRQTITFNNASEATITIKGLEENTSYYVGMLADDGAYYAEMYERPSKGYNFAPIYYDDGLVQPTADVPNIDYSFELVKFSSE